MPQDSAHLPVSQSRTPSEGPTGPRSSTLAAGGTYFLGRYRVVDEIGVGGMASVHLARMDGPGGFQKWVAIKRIHPHLVEDESFVNMFLDEARVAARISHPNVATVFELGKHSDTYWIAMEYLHGEPLREVMRRTEELGQPMPPEIACRAIADAAEGLHSAHELLGRNGEKLNLVHRDVTPHNLFVTYEGCTKVVDFGIAKFSSRMANTRAGTLKGKLAYMSPEQVAGEPIDRRTDVFALGVVLWELTTGQRLFRMENDLDTLAKVQECNVPRPSSIVRGYPIDLEKIVTKALAKTKNERYRTAREFSRALQSLLMRRGLFIASDEVAAYMTSIFGDRIQKREAHLRWAAEVTQTIDVDALKPVAPSPWQGDDGSLLTYNSEVQASQSGAPRPAAGAPAADSQPSLMSGPSTSVATPAAVAKNDLRSTVRLGNPVATVPPRAPAPRTTTLASPVDTVRDDVPTIARPRPANSAAGNVIDDYDDGGDTIVTESPHIEDISGDTGSSMGTSRTQAASPRAMTAHSAPRPAPPRMPVQPQMPAVVVRQPAPTMRLSPPPYQAAPGPAAFQGPPVPYPQQQQYQQHQQPMGPPYSSGYPGQPPGQPMYGAPGLGDAQRLFAQPARNEQRTITAQALKRRIPVWAVAVGSALTGLVAFGLVVLVLSRPSSPHVATAPSSAPVAPAPPPAVTVHATPPPSPFLSARTQFVATLGPAAPTAPASSTNDAIAPAPTGSAPASAVPPGEPAPIPTANVNSLPPAGAEPSSAAAAPSPHAPAARAAAAQAPSPAAVAAASGGTGTLKVICFPGCDQVVDNGASLGPSPIVRKNASLGSHRVKLVWSDTTKIVSTVVIADQTATVRENHP